jgi:hypothetical protein
VKFSLRQILASAAGAVLAALIASAFGVKGTIIGVAIGSAAATTGTALVAQSIDRGHKAVKQVAVRVPETSVLRKLGATGASGGSDASVDAAPAPTEVQAGTSAGSGDTPEMQAPAAPLEETRQLEVSAVAEAPATAHLRGVTEPAPPGSISPPSRRFTWKAIAGTAAVVFVLALLFITAVELIAGKPLSSIFGHAGTGTSVNNIFGPSPAPGPTTTTTTTTTSTSSTTTTTTSPTTTSTTSSTGSSSTTTTGGPAASTTTTTGLGATTTTTPPTTTTSLSLPRP